MYQYVKNRVINVLEIFEYLSMIIIKNESNDYKESMIYISKLMTNIYESIVQEFITYLARCPIRKACNDLQSQVIILNDLSLIIKQLFVINNEWKQANEQDNDQDNDQDDDIEMNEIKTENLVKLPKNVVKHIKRSIVEITDNIDDKIKNDSNVIENLNCLNNLSVKC